MLRFIEKLGNFEMIHRHILQDAVSKGPGRGRGEEVKQKKIGYQDINHKLRLNWLVAIELG